jgi:hypothetical protein
MESEGSWPYSQATAIHPYPEPTPSSPHHPSNFLTIHLNIVLPSTSGSPQWPLFVRFPHQHPVHTSLLPIRATCPAHLILDFITRTILGKEYLSFTSCINKINICLSYFRLLVTFLHSLCRWNLFIETSQLIEGCITCARSNRLKFLSAAVTKVCMHIPCSRFLFVFFFCDVFSFVRSRLLVRHMTVCVPVITAFN